MKHEVVGSGYRAFVTRSSGDAGRDWLASLPSLHATLAERWGLDLGPELPGGLLSCVRAVRRADGAEAVLKIGSSPRTRDEIAALRAWAGEGAPALLDADVELRSLLLERVVPGEHLADAAAADVAGVMRLLHAAPPPDLPPLADTVRQRLEASLRDGRSSKPKTRWALAKAAELEESPAATVLLHGDLDERNLLVCRHRGLCAIDPLPCAGDPAYDAGYWVHGNRRPGRRARLDAIVAATGLERARVRDWAAIVGVHG